MEFDRIINVLLWYFICFIHKESIIKDDGNNSFIDEYLRIMFLSVAYVNQ